ncbi:MAG: transketolase family protein [Christensenellaceae bacterium]|nr:transketolase family protein [Christensenellaceae bacterium]
MEMRAVFSKTLEDMMAKDDKICVIDADLAKAGGTWYLRNVFPERALDVGIAEANMAGVAAGLTSFGFKPWISTFTAFISRRIADQVAISISYAKRNVKIVGTDAGLLAEYNGGTHMSMEDVAIMRAIPGLVVFEAVDNVQLAKAMPAIDAYEGPVYVRVGRKKVEAVFDDDYKFDLFKADVLKEGKDVTIIASGIMVKEALNAQAMLAEEGIDAEIINLHTIKPVDEETVMASVNKTGCVVTAENASIIGGVYSAISELLSQNKPTPIVPIGVKDRFGEVGLLPYLKETMGMTAADIVAAAKKSISMKCC